MYIFDRMASNFKESATFTLRYWRPDYQARNEMPIHCLADLGIIFKRQISRIAAGPAQQRLMSTHERLEQGT